MTTAATISEADFQRQVVDLARIFRWKTNHIRRSIGKGKRWTTSTSMVGWPDLALVRPPRLIFAELKSADGKLTAEQEQVLGLLRGCDGVEVYVWRPDDLEAIAAVLR